MKKNLLLMGALLASGSALAIERDMTKVPEAIYRRCFSMLTGGDFLAANDATLASVKSGTITAVNACMALLEKAKLSPNLPAGSQFGYDPIGLKVLKSMNDFHRSWFANDKFVSFTSAEQDSDTAHSLYDSTEPALFITRSLLADLPVDSILTNTTGVRANRYTVAALNKNASNVDDYAINTTGAHKFTVGASATDQAPWYPTPLVEVGRLVGISDGNPAVLVPNFHGYGYENTVADFPQTNINVLANAAGELSATLPTCT